jgi:hypothetical protein
MNQLVPVTADRAPALVAAAGARASYRFFEFFTAVKFNRRIVSLGARAGLGCAAADQARKAMTAIGSDTRLLESPSRHAIAVLS